MAVNIAVAGDNLGAIVVGDHNTVVINQPAGAVVLPPQPVQTTRREGPANLGPRPFPDIVDRVAENNESRAALAAVPPSSVDVSGPPGVGKTALLRHVCGDSGLAASFPDGVVYLNAAGQSAADVLQQLFEAFFETDRPFKPDETQLRRFLARTTPLVMLDGYLGSPAEFDRLLNLAATATFAVSGPQRILLGEGCAIALGGLPPSDALALMSRELARPFDESEVMPARTICAALDGNPLNVILVAAHSRVYGVPLTQLAEEVRAADSPEEWLKALIESKLSDRDRAALAAFAAVDCAPLDASEVAAIGGEPAAETLEGLRDRRLVEYDGKRNRVRIGIAAAIAMSFLGMLPAEAAAQSFLQTAAQAPQSTLVEHSDAILGALKNAVLAGKHADVMALAHRAGDAVALSGRWDRWQEMLQQALSAAKAAHDSAAEAWALHQIGSRALAIGDVAAAQTALQAAMHIRAGLNDPTAQAVTQHNLQVLGAQPAAQAEHAHVQSSAARIGLGAKVAVGVACVALVGSLGAWVAAHPSVSGQVAKPRISPGQSTKLCYSANHVSNVRINGVAAPNGCLDVHPTQTTTYRIEATGPLGIPVAAQPVRVEVAPPGATSPQQNPSSTTTNGSNPQNGQPPSTTTTESSQGSGPGRNYHQTNIGAPLVLPPVSNTGPTQGPTQNGGQSPCSPQTVNETFNRAIVKRTTPAPGCGSTIAPPTHTPCAFAKVAGCGTGTGTTGQNQCGSQTVNEIYYGATVKGGTPAPGCGSGTGTTAQNPCGSKTDHKKNDVLTIARSKQTPGCGSTTGNATNASTKSSGATTQGSSTTGATTHYGSATGATTRNVPETGTTTHYVPTDQIERGFSSPSGYAEPGSQNPYSHSETPYSHSGSSYTRPVPYATPAREAPVARPRATMHPTPHTSYPPE